MFLINLIKIFLRPQYWLIFFKGITKLQSIKSRQYDIIFFFPFYHIGGAERVHIDILHAIPEARKLIIFTNISRNNKLLEEFSSKSAILDLGFCLSKKYLNFFVVNLLVSTVNKLNPKYVYGCNSKLYYQILPAINPSILKFDLIHAFSDNIEAAEHWSLPVVKYLDKRALISHKAIQELSELYISNSIPEEYIKNIVFISNGINVPSTLIEKKYSNERLDVIYIGRASPEKRIKIIEKVSSKLSNHDIFFTYVGFIPDEVNTLSSNSNYLGEINDQDALRELYTNSDVLILSSNREGFPMVIMEAMSYGCIPLCTAVGDIPNRLENNKNALLINSNNELEIIELFSHKLIQLKKDILLRKELSLNAYEQSKEFDIKTFNESYRDLFKIA
jgi:glycosyltransferase involved in cell wall biosynthesis